MRRNFNQAKNELCENFQIYSRKFWCVYVCVLSFFTLLFCHLNAFLSLTSNTCTHSYCIRRWAVVQTYSIFWDNMYTSPVCEGRTCFVSHTYLRIYLALCLYIYIHMVCLNGTVYVMSAVCHVCNASWCGFSYMYMHASAINSKCVVENIEEERCCVVCTHFSKVSAELVGRNALLNVMAETKEWQLVSDIVQSRKCLA